MNQGMGYKLTGNIGYASNSVDVLERYVIDGSKTAVCEFGAERSFYGDGALRAVRGLAQQKIGVRECGQSKPIHKLLIRSNNPILRDMLNAC